MYRTVADFLEEWNASAAGTLRAFKALNNEALDVAIVEGHNTLGWLAWHLVGATGFFCHTAGLKVPMIDHKAPVPTDITYIIEQYEQISKAINEEASNLSDNDMVEEIKSFAGPIPRGKLLRTFIDHQTHHRGQMTVLIRQAGLTVPALLGPTKEMASKA